VSAGASTAQAQALSMAKSAFVLKRKGPATKTVLPPGGVKPPTATSSVNSKQTANAPPASRRAQYDNGSLAFLNVMCMAARKLLTWVGAVPKWTGIWIVLEAGDGSESAPFVGKIIDCARGEATTAQSGAFASDWWEFRGGKEGRRRRRSAEGGDKRPRKEGDARRADDEDLPRGDARGGGCSGERGHVGAGTGDDGQDGGGEGQVGVHSAAAASSSIGDAGPVGSASVPAFQLHSRSVVKTVAGSSMGTRTLREADLKKVLDGGGLEDASQITWNDIANFFSRAGGVLRARCDKPTQFSWARACPFGLLGNRWSAPGFKHPVDSGHFFPLNHSASKGSGIERKRLVVCVAAHLSPFYANILSSCMAAALVSGKKRRSNPKDPFADSSKISSKRRKNAAMPSNGSTPSKVELSAAAKSSAAKTAAAKNAAAKAATANAAAAKATTATDVAAKVAAAKTAPAKTAAAKTAAAKAAAAKAAATQAAAAKIAAAKTAPAKVAAPKTAAANTATAEATAAKPAAARPAAAKPAAAKVAAAKVAAAKGAARAPPKHPPSAKAGSNAPLVTVPPDGAAVGTGRGGAAVSGGGGPIVPMAEQPLCVLVRAGERSRMHEVWMRRPCPLLPPSTMLSAVSLSGSALSEAARASVDIRVVLPRSLLKEAFGALTAAQRVATPATVDVAGRSELAVRLTVGNHDPVYAFSSTLMQMGSVLAFNESVQSSKRFISWMGTVVTSNAYLPAPLHFYVRKSASVADVAAAVCTDVSGRFLSDCVWALPRASRRSSGTRSEFGAFGGCSVSVRDVLDAGQQAYLTNALLDSGLGELQLLCVAAKSPSAVLSCSQSASFTSIAGEEVSLQRALVSILEVLDGWDTTVEQYVMLLNIDNTHWISATVSLSTGFVIVYDSLAGFCPAKKAILSKLLLFARQAEIRWRTFHPKSVDAIEWQTAEVNTPRQADTYNCALFAFSYIWCTLLGQDFESMLFEGDHLRLSFIYFVLACGRAQSSAEVEERGDA